MIRRWHDLFEYNPIDWMLCVGHKHPPYLSGSGDVFCCCCRLFWYCGTPPPCCLLNCVEPCFIVDLVQVILANTEFKQQAATVPRRTLPHSLTQTQTDRQTQTRSSRKKPITQKKILRKYRKFTKLNFLGELIFWKMCACLGKKRPEVGLEIFFPLVEYYTTEICFIWKRNRKNSLSAVFFLDEKGMFSFGCCL